jgi:multiple sugar transport system ATP-binding protein
MIAGLESITSGTLSIDGRSMNAVAARDRDIAMVFQSYALYPHKSVAENLAFGLRRRNFPRPEIERRVTNVAETLGLTPYLKRKPHALSGGQRQRVALGRAIVRDPKVFLFDEPLSNLDAALRVSMRAELARLHRKLGATMIYVTHDQVEAMTMGTRICIMHGGKVAQAGVPLDVYRRPANTFVAGFLGNPPMNLLPVRFEADGAAQTILLGSARLPIPPGRAFRPPSSAEVTFGIRPEHIADRPGAGIAIETEIVAMEQLGAETIMSLRVAGVEKDITARLPGQSQASVGQPFTAFFDLDQTHLFDGNGRSLLL